MPPTPLEQVPAPEPSSDPLRSRLAHFCLHPALEPSAADCTERTEQLERFFYRQQTGQCETFLYSGCRATHNHFVTRSDCERTCRPLNMCFQPMPRRGATCEDGATVTKDFYNMATSVCELVNFQQCEEMPNSFSDIESCILTCTQDPCAAHRCPHGGVCRSAGPGGEPLCECPRCTDAYSPVCATDGTSYNNECKLRLEACEKRLDLRVQYIGLCKGCENKRCPHYGICESRPNGEAACTCPRTCVPHVDPVCGIDGLTYANECEMKVAACNKQQFVTAAYKGDCDLCQHVVCKYGARCEAGRCVCPTDCPGSSDPVCGTDGRSYDNECLMQARACTADHQLSTAYVGPCQHSANITVSPCYGLEPLINPETSAPYPCSEGAGCPAGAYCHRSADGALCCPLAPATVAPLDTTGAPDSTGTPGTLDSGDKPPPSCANSSHGCCEDGSTSAAGPGGAGCPAACRCHRLGALGPQCDPVTRRCACRPGVGGRFCDCCRPGFWGLPKIARGNTGCQPCGCSTFGSARDDCEQSHGFCVCKPGVFGSNCNKCPPGERLLLNGCGKGELKTTATTCDELPCYFGAACVQKTATRAECSCNLTCPDPAGDALEVSLEQEVCVTDGQTYRSACQLSLFACRDQRDITIEGFGRCAEKGTSLEPTGIPFRRSTLFQPSFTEQSSPSAAKSTRHLLPEYESSVSPGGHTPQDGSFLVQGCLGSPCGRDSECRVALSHCRAGLYQCQPGYQEAPNRQQCTLMTQPMLTTEGVTRLVLNPCMSRPCLHGGVCQQSDADHESFSCLCPDQWTGDTCERQVGPPTVAPPAAGGDTYERPSFSGRSLLTLRAPKATIKLQLEMEFVSHAADGLLLCGQQTENGTGDFIALALVDGFLEFRYDIGNGPVVIRSIHKVSQGEYHKVVARRYHGDGQLIVDDGESIHGQSDGKRRSLDLSEELFVGYVPSKDNRVYENAGTVFGLVGCVRRLRLGGAVSADLQFPGSRDILTSRGVTQCRADPCSSQNGGLCVLTTGHRYLCQCAERFTGVHCEETSDPCSAAGACAGGATCTSAGNSTLHCLYPTGRWGHRCQEVRTDHISDLLVPNFGGSSYLQLRPLRDSGRSLELELWFLARSPDGLLVYSAQSGNSGDFIGLRLTAGRLEFGYDLGSGPASIRTKHPLPLNKWHSVKLTRFNRDGSLQLGNDTVLRGSAPGALTELNLDLPLYIGGVDSGTAVKPAFGDSSLGLDGAVQAVGINGALITDLMAAAQSSSKITRYIGAPCGGSPCKNGGRCLPRLTSYVCRCTSSYTGRYCHKKRRRTRLDRVTARRQTDAVHFSGKAFVVLPNMIRRARKRQKSNRLSFQLRTAHPDGLIARQGRLGSVDGNFFSVGLANGTVQLTFNLARSRRGIVTLGSKHPVSDGRWHRVRVRRRRRWASVQVDRHRPERTARETRGRSRLHTDGKLYIGGAPSLPSGLPFHCYWRFSGCLCRLSVSKRSVNLATHVDNVKLHRCPAV